MTISGSVIDIDLGVNSGLMYETDGAEVDYREILSEAA